VALALIKISLVLFYLQIFNSPGFKISAYCVLVFVTINSLIIFFITIFICTPVSFFWNRDIKGKCMDLQALAYASSASAIVQDFILLILPLVFIRNVKMKKYRKIGAAFMFSIGSFGCITTILRLHTLTTFKISIDPTWDYVPTTIWTEFELAAGGLCVSLPSIRIFVIKALPERFKNFLSHISQQSRKWSQPTPKQSNALSSQGGWKTPPSWIVITAGNDSRDVCSSRTSVMALSTDRQMCVDSLRAESTLSNHSDSQVSATCPPFLNEWHQQDDEHIEMRKFPNQHITIGNASSAPNMV
jgi:hypothetical protein